MQGGRKKFTFRTKHGNIFCEICIRKKEGRILFSEVRNHERRRKKTDPLGSGGSQAAGDPLRPSGKPGAELKRPSRNTFLGTRNISSIESGGPNGVTAFAGLSDSNRLRALARKKTGPQKRSCFSFVLFQRISRWHASERSTRCRKRDGRTWAGREPLPRHRNERR